MNRHTIVSANRDLKACFSLMLESKNGTMAIQVVVTRAPDEAATVPDTIDQLRTAVSPDRKLGIALVERLATAGRSIDGQPGFYVKYEGIQHV